MGLDAETVRKEWVSGVLPGVQIVPAGIWALERANNKMLLHFRGLIHGLKPTRHLEDNFYDKVWSFIVFMLPGVRI